MNKGMRVGYARVSTSGQKLDLQLERLADCDRTFHEKVSGKSAKNRPELHNALDFVRDGDVFVVTKVDRLQGQLSILRILSRNLRSKMSTWWCWIKESTRPLSMADFNSISWRPLVNLSWELSEKNPMRADCVPWHGASNLGPGPN